MGFGPETDLQPLHVRQKTYAWTVRRKPPNTRLAVRQGFLKVGVINRQARSVFVGKKISDFPIRISEQVIAEVERNITRKAPKALPFTRELILRANIRILHDPPRAEIIEHLDWISHPADVPILVVAARARVDFLVTLNTKHFIDDPDVSRRSGLRIGTPGEALAWVREQFSKTSE